MFNQKAPFFKSRNDFAELCGISSAYFTMNFKRAKIVVNEKSQVDISLPINLDFIFNRLVEKIIPNKVPPARVPKLPSRVAIGPDAEKSIAGFDLDRAKKLLDIEEKETSIAINKIKLDKLNGVVIPTDLVTVIFGQHTKSITTAFHQAADVFIVEMAAKYEVDKKDIAVMRGTLIEIINESVKDSLEDSKKGIANIVDEYAINGK